MLDVFSYPVSVLMMLWHDLVGLVIDPNSGAAWVASILLLVCTVRLLLIRPTWKQLVSGRRVAALRPQLLALKAKHGTDQFAYATAARQLHKDEGVSLLGFLPALLQLPVFLGLYHLLAGFSTGTGSNGVFGPEQVQSFAHAELFGVPLAAGLRTTAEALAALQPGLTLPAVMIVAVPLLLVAALATYINVTVAARRQAALPVEADNPMAAMSAQLVKMMVWFAPVSVLLGGVMFPVPVALLLYWVINGSWTTVQTVLMNRRLDQSFAVAAIPAAS